MKNEVKKYLFFFFVYQAAFIINSTLYTISIKVWSQRCMGSMNIMYIGMKLSLLKEILSLE